MSNILNSICVQQLSKESYYSLCKFKLSQKEMEQIPGFNLLKIHGMYHPVRNPLGMVRDHILSRAEGYLKKYNPAHIRHPANCQFITNLENIKKNMHSDITYEQLIERITLWEQNIVPLLSKERRKIEKSPAHIENIRISIIRRYADIRSGKLTSDMGTSLKAGRKETFSHKHDWSVINELILQGHTLASITRMLPISIDDLTKARRQGLISRPA